MSSPDAPPLARGAGACALVLLLVASAPSAAAHGDDGPYDPLEVALHAYLHPDRSVQEVAPEPGVVPFGAATPGGAPPEIVFAFAAPVAFTPAAPLQVALTLRADQLTIARDAEGNAIELQALPDGEAVRVALAESVLAPGSVVTIEQAVPPPARAFAEGEEVALAVRALMPGLAQGALSVVTGGDAPSRLDLARMRVPSVAALGLQDVPHTEIVLGVDRFEPPETHVVNTFRVGHASVERPPGHGWSASGTYVVLEGVETAEAELHRFPDRARRVEAAHEFTVNGVVARVHPGLAVIVRAPTLPIVIECARHCPPEGFAYTIAPPSDAPGEPPSALLPPPRATTGIPVSEDEPPAKETPAPALFLVALALALAARAKR